MGKAVRRMGGRQPFEGTYGEGSIVANLPSSTDLGNQKLSATNMDMFTDHRKFPEQPAVPKSRPNQKISRCRICRKSTHDIKSCHPFHTNGEGIVQDDDPSRKFAVSIVYHFPHEPSVEYASNTKMLANPPRRELCSQSEYSTGREAKDYLLDPKPDPVDEVLEGQSRFFHTNTEKVSTTKKKRNRKTIITTLENRFIY